MTRKRRILGDKFKAKVALAAVRGDQTMAQSLASIRSAERASMGGSEFYQEKATGR